jgi:hypothetical protein
MVTDFLGRLEKKGSDMRRAIAVAVVLSCLGAAAAWAGAWTGTPSFCMNAVSCNYSLKPSGAIGLQVSYLPSLPSQPGESAAFTGTGQIILPGDHQWSYLAPDAWTGTIYYDGPGNPAYYYTEYRIVGTFTGTDTAPGPNNGTPVTGNVNMSVECHSTKCHPDPDAAGGLTISN